MQLQKGLQVKQKTDTFLIFEAALMNDCIVQTQERHYRLIFYSSPWKINYGLKIKLKIINR